MTDNIKPEHYRTGEIDLFEEWYLTYPFEQYRAIMQSHAEKYLRRVKNDRVEDLGKAIYTLEVLRKKEIEHDERYSCVETKDGDMLVKSESDEIYDDNLYLLKQLQKDDFNYLARNKDNSLWVYSYAPKKGFRKWTEYRLDVAEETNNNNFPEVKWSDKYPTRISDLLEKYKNCGENGK